MKTYYLTDENRHYVFKAFLALEESVVDRITQLERKLTLQTEGSEAHCKMLEGIKNLQEELFTAKRQRQRFGFREEEDNDLTNAEVVADFENRRRLNDKRDRLA